MAAETPVPTAAQTPAIDLDSKITDTQLGKALRSAAERAHLTDRTTWVILGGERVAAVVPTSVGELFYAPPDPAAVKPNAPSRFGPRMLP